MSSMLRQSSLNLTLSLGIIRFEWMETFWKQHFTCTRDIMNFWSCHLDWRMRQQTFQSHINQVLHSFLHCFVLIIFDDILVYNIVFETHMKHFIWESFSISCKIMLFLVMERNVYFVKIGNGKKCAFCEDRVSYFTLIWVIGCPRWNESK